jgi:hypothetical protein
MHISILVNMITYFTPSSVRIIYRVLSQERLKPDVHEELVCI